MFAARVFGLAIGGSEVVSLMFVILTLSMDVLGGGLINKD